MRQSASMAEIATEDGTREEEEEPAAGDKDKTKAKEGEEETRESGGQTSSQSGESSETSSPQINLESDSDTEDEEEVVTKSSSAPNSCQTPAPETPTVSVQPLLSASITSSPPPAGAPNVVSGINATDSTAPPNPPPSPGRCISVSSPGRGHKIFMVTRVESPPEQQQLQRSAPKEASKKPAEVKTQPAQPPPASQRQQAEEGVKEGSSAPSLDCKVTEQSPVALNTTQTHTLGPQSDSPPTEDVTASTLDPEAADPSPALQSKVPEAGTESNKGPQTEPTLAEAVKKDKEEGVKDEAQVNKLSPSFPAAETQQPPLASADEQLKNELASASEETQSLNQTAEKEKESLPPQGNQDAAADVSENEKPSLTEEESIPPRQEELSPTQQTEAGELVLPVHTDQQTPSVTQGGAQEESDLQGGDASKSPVPAPIKAEESPDESSADEGESFSEAHEEDVVASSLPNGLKQEFSLHLLEADSPKPGSCVMEHGEIRLFLQIGGELHMWNSLCNATYVPLMQ